MRLMATERTKMGLVSRVLERQFSGGKVSRQMRLSNNQHCLVFRIHRITLNGRL
jgi:hypothetical protein